MTALGFRGTVFGNRAPCRKQCPEPALQSVVLGTGMNASRRRKRVLPWNPSTTRACTRTHTPVGTCPVTHSLPQDQSHATNTDIRNHSHYALGAQERELATSSEGHWHRETTWTWGAQDLQVPSPHMPARPPQDRPSSQCQPLPLPLPRALREPVTILTKPVMDLVLFRFCFSDRDMALII